MFLHSCIPVSSEKHADLVFENLFELDMAYDFTINPDISLSLFHFEKTMKARVYKCGAVFLEVFITDNLPHPPTFHHICLMVQNREQIIQKARDMKLEIREKIHGDKKTVFIVDFDGNLYEIKNSE